MTTVITVNSNGPQGTTVTTGNVASPTRPDQIEPYTFSYLGPLGTFTGTGRLYLENPYTLQSIRFSLGAVSTSGAVTLDVKKNGTSIYTTKPVIPVNTFSVAANANLATTSFSANDYLTVDIISPGLNGTATDLTVTLRLKRLY
jgi:hypothetical protein